MKGDEKKKRLKRVLIMLIFYSASYLSLNVLENLWYNNLFGVLFLISGLYGTIKIGRGEIFIY